MFTPTPRVDFSTMPRPAFGMVAAHLDTATPRVSAKARARQTRAAQLATEALPDLPRPGESIHILMTGYYDLMSLISTTARRLTRCNHLRTATLAMSRRNAAELVDLLAAGKVERLTLILSAFFRAHNKELYDTIATDLEPFPGTTISAARNHAKVATFESPDGWYVFESSANLRSNRCSEFLTAFNDRGLFQFHNAWIDDRAQKYEETDAPG